MNVQYTNTETGCPMVFATLTTECIIKDETPLKNGRACLEYLAKVIKDTPRETSYAIFMDDEYAAICVARLGVGTNVSTPLSARDVVQVGLLCNARYVSLVHNHPGDRISDFAYKPSDTDVRITDKIMRALALVDISLKDSYIVSRFVKDGESYPNYYSMSLHGFNRLRKRAEVCKHHENFLAGTRKDDDIYETDENNLLWGKEDEILQRCELDDSKEEHDLDISM